MFEFIIHQAGIVRELVSLGEDVPCLNISEQRPSIGEVVVLATVLL